MISPISATSLVLSWSGPCYDGGSAIQGYVVEVKSDGSAQPGDWREATAQCKSTSYKVSGLQPLQEYCFRVSAYNEAGISEPGPVSPVVRMEQKGTAHLDLRLANRQIYEESYSNLSLCRFKQTTERGAP